MKKIVFIAFLNLFVLAHAQQLQLPVETHKILESFSHNEIGLSRSFVDLLPVQIYQDMLSRKDGFFNKSKNVCKDYFNVTFSPNLLSTTNEAEKVFMDGMIRIESAKCFVSGSPEELVNISRDSQFKERAFSTLKRIQPNGKNDCEWTDAPSIGRSNYCYDNFIFNEKNEVSLVTSLTRNNFDKEFDAPVYLRQSVTSAKKKGTQTSFYTVSYVRSVSLSEVKQFFATGFIRSTQEKVFSEMQLILNEKAR